MMLAENRRSPTALELAGNKTSDMIDCKSKLSRIWLELAGNKTSDMMY